VWNAKNWRLTGHPSVGKATFGRVEDAELGKGGRYMFDI